MVVVVFRSRVMKTKSIKESLPFPRSYNPPNTYRGVNVSGFGGVVDYKN